jgi:hypothetical protein
MAEESANYYGEWVSFSYDLQEVWGHGKTAMEADEMSFARTGMHGALFFMDPDWDKVLLF